MEWLLLILILVIILGPSLFALLSIKVMIDNNEQELNDEG